MVQALTLVSGALAGFARWSQTESPRRQEIERVLVEFASSEVAALIQVVLIDLVLAGDNAIIVGMAAAGVAPQYRRRVIFWGICIAVILRVLFAATTVQLLQVIGLTLAGGLVLLWVCWKFYRELASRQAEAIGTAALGDGDNAAGAAQLPAKSIRAAIWHVALADVSMSLDNVLAVAGAAGGYMSALIFGLALSVVLMGVAASVIARLLQRHHWIGYLGLVLVAYVALSMIWHGVAEVGAVI